MDKSYRDIIAEQINPYSLIKRSVYHERNKEKSWQFRKYTDIDENFICISKDGTIGEVWKVGGLIIALPSSEGKQIINIDKSDDDSIWRRTKIPEEFLHLERDYKRKMRRARHNERKSIRNWYFERKKVLESKHSEFIAQEFHRRKHGVFIKIDDQICYLTGENYMFLNYYYLAEDKIYPNFRITAMHTWWHWEACVSDQDCWGELRLKSRRVSWTSEACSIALNGLTLNKYAEIPVVSENDRLAKKLFTKKIVNPFKYYPSYFIPLIEDPNDKPKTELEIIFDTDDQETSTISFYPTKDVAYDSTKAFPISINDEVGKYINVTFTEFRGNHKDCHFQGLTKIVSTAKFGSTAGSFAKGGESFMYEFENANPLKRDKLGRTGTGLIALFVDCCYTSGGFFDKWGYPVLHDPKEPIENEDGRLIEFGAITAWEIESEKKKKQKKSDYNNFLRQQPRTIEHAFRNESGVHNDFDADNLNNHIAHLKGLTEGQLSEIIYRGNLVWEGEPYTSNVIWKPNTNGKIFTTWIPTKEQQNKCSERTISGSLSSKKYMMPDNHEIGFLGVDSYDIGKTVDGIGSNGAVVGYTKFNMAGAPSHSFFLKYAERPDKRDDFYDDVIKMCKFFGMFALIESNKPRLLEYMEEKGFRGYSLTRPDKKWKDLSDHERDFGGIPSSEQGNKDQASLLKTYIMDNVGQNLEKECNVYFLDLVQEWVKFNVKKRKEFDLSVACQLALLASQYQIKKRRNLNIGGADEGSLSISSLSA